MLDGTDKDSASATATANNEVESQQNGDDETKKRIIPPNRSEKMAQDTDSRPSGEKPRSRKRSRSRSPRRSGGGGRGRRDSAQQNNDRMVYISNIPYDVRWMEIKDLCREKAGEVNYVEMLETPDRKSKGCAVVEFKEKEMAKKCVEAMHRMQMKDRYIVAKEIRDPIAFFRKVKEDIGVDFLANRSGGGGGSGIAPLMDTGRGRGGPMQYETYGLSPSFLRGLGIDGPLCARVFVANLPYNVQSGKIYEVFGVSGKVTMVDLQLDKEGKSKGLAVVEFSHPIEAVQAVSMLNNQRIYDRSITVKMDRYEKGPDLRRPGELPVGLKGVGMGLGNNGQPLTNVDQLINALPSAQPTPQSMLGGPQSLLSGLGGGSVGGGGGGFSSLGGGLSLGPSSMAAPASQGLSVGGGYGSAAGGGAYGGSGSSGITGFDGGMPSVGMGGYGGGLSQTPSRGIMGSGLTGASGDGRVSSAYEGPPSRRDYDSQGRLSPLGARRSSRAIIIQNLPTDYTWQMVRDRLRGFGDIEFADIVQPGIAKVRFKTGMEAERAVSGLNGMSVEGRPITVDFGYND